MGQIFTSRYGNRAIDSRKHYAVGISIGRPKFKLGYELRAQCFSLAPKGYMLHMDAASFREAYFRKLEGNGTEQIINMVLRLEKAAEAEGKDLVLLCFEDVRVPGDWCHRTMFAEWWAEKTGEMIEELEDPLPPKGLKRPPAEPEQKKEVQAKEEPGQGFEQMSLFDL